jgi:hypothetical protein
MQEIKYIKVNDLKSLEEACKQLDVTMYEYENVVDIVRAGFFDFNEQQVVVAKMSDQLTGNIAVLSEVEEYANSFGYKMVEMEQKIKMVINCDIYCNCTNKAPKTSYTLTSSFSFCQNCRREIV